MSRVDVVRAAMVEAMKAKDKARKDSLSMLLSALKNAEIDKRSPLTEEEADAVVKKEIKQTKETLELAPADRADIREEAQARLAVYQEFAPEDLTEEQIAEVIKSVLAELGIENPAPSDKGKIMKTLMPKVKGKADGKVVNCAASTASVRHTRRAIRSAKVRAAHWHRHSKWRKSMDFPSTITIIM